MEQKSKMRKLMSLAAAALLSAGAANAADAVATISVDPAGRLCEVNRLVFGHNVQAARIKDIGWPKEDLRFAMTGDGVWDPVNARPVKEIADFSKEIGVSMLRYPGGCYVHNYDWKETTGPLEGRPEFAFGLDEFMKLCETIGAEPVMEVADYFGTAQDAADLVEYLNSPADAAHPWAMKRARNGHPKPYGVRFFEIGNETYHKNHSLKPARKFRPEEYGQMCKDYSLKMKAVDPSIKTGFVLRHLSTPLWTKDAAPIAGPYVDFLIDHLYSEGSGSTEETLRSCMAGKEALLERNRLYRQEFAAASGRDLPVAITEFNIQLAQTQSPHAPFTYAGALFSGDLAGAMLLPENKVLFANYWQYVNCHFGFLRSYDFKRKPPPLQPAASWKRLPAFYVFKLWKEHFGKELASCQTDSPWARASDGRLVEKPRPKGLPSERPLEMAESPAESPAISLSREKGPDGEAFVWSVSNLTGNAWPKIALLSPRKGERYRLSLEARANSSTAFESFNIGIAFHDARGWQATHSGSAIEGVEGSQDWSRFECSLKPREDASALKVFWCIESKASQGGALKDAKLEVRNVRIEALPDNPDYKALTAYASASEDGRTVYVMAFNRSQEELETSIQLAKGEAEGAKGWGVSGALDATNLEREEVGEAVPLEAPKLIGPQELRCRLKPCSMNAFEIKLK